MESLSNAFMDLAESFQLPFTTVLGDATALMSEDPQLTADELLCNLQERYEKEKPFHQALGESVFEELAVKPDVYHITVAREADGSANVELSKGVRLIAEQLQEVTGGYVIVSDERVKITKL